MHIEVIVLVFEIESVRYIHYNCIYISRLRLSVLHNLRTLVLLLVLLLFGL
jgi:hypothetical protein